MALTGFFLLAGCVEPLGTLVCRATRRLQRRQQHQAQAQPVVQAERGTPSGPYPTTQEPST